MTDDTPRRRDRTRVVPAESLRRARTLRQPQTRAEHTLWRCLRGRRLEGYKFRRQLPIGKYIPDFCCPATRVIVEVDGETHIQQEAYDKRRSEDLERMGYHILRFTNAHVYQHVESVLEAILVECRKRGEP